MSRNTLLVTLSNETKTPRRQNSHNLSTPRYPGPRNTTTQPARPTEAERTPRPTRAASGSSGVTPPSATEIGALGR